MKLSENLDMLGMAPTYLQEIVNCDFPSHNKKRQNIELFAKGDESYPG